ncbi:unnamed protein product [Kuraishia capsulata CBS 1993]|uniref:Uncharacterized protein n=1 Tax=Kuraishia capsulata CBS 1993 TaxID=1382522 RepID=W6MIK3_9ASCO|nr:uncharacterized protein KUCA_T00002275001 [Kuraishia capsulata CBS 1993]CDK26304.1 unnamed protein product [Kuraishia capsulata CBS 1993]
MAALGPMSESSGEPRRWLLKRIQTNWLIKANTSNSMSLHDDQIGVSDDAGIPEFEDDTSSDVDDSSATLTGLQVCDVLRQAAVDAVETQDWLSYATLLDIHLGADPDERYDEEEKTALLQTLNEVLVKYPQITYEIGWDLPAMLLEFANSRWLTNRLIESEGIMLVISVFGLLAKNGNPKEVFLRCCEMLAVLYRDPVPTAEELADYDDETREFVLAMPVRAYKMKYHLLVELMTASLRRIETNYPSRFLGMAISAFINFFDTAELYAGQVFFARRVYTFIRDYLPPPAPAEPQDDEEERLALVKVRETEEYLQRKMLRFFLSVAVEQTVSLYPTEWTLTYFQKIQGSKPLATVNDALGEMQSLDYSIREDSLEIVDRLVMLALSLDFDLEKMFLKELDATRLLFKSLDYTTSLDAQNDALFSLVIDNYNKTGLRKQPDSFDPSFIGVFLMFTHSLVHSYPDAKLSISPSDAIKMYIRFAIPGVIRGSTKIAFQDALLHLCWRAIYEWDGDAEADLRALEPILINTFLQVLTTESTSSVFRSKAKMILTLIAKVLTLVSEQTAWNYLHNSLETCPYEQVKPTFISLLKDLLLRTKPVSVDSLTQKVKAASLESKSTAPALPPRESYTYISLNADRQDQLEALVTTATEDLPTDQKDIDVLVAVQTVQTLLSYLNLLVFLREKFPNDRFVAIMEKISAKVAEYNNSVSEEANQERISKGFNIDLLTLAIDNINGATKKT